MGALCYPFRAHPRARGGSRSSCPVERRPVPSASDPASRPSAAPV